MTKYEEFLEAYKNAYPYVRKQLQYEQAQKLWKSLKSEPEKFEEKLREKMSEMKVLHKKNSTQNLKFFTQSKLNFGRVWVSQLLISNQAFL